MSSSSIWPIDRILSSATTPGQGGPGSNGHEGALLGATPKLSGGEDSVPEFKEVKSHSFVAIPMFATL